MAQKRAAAGTKKGGKNIGGEYVSTPESASSVDLHRPITSAPTAEASSPPVTNASVVAAYEAFGRSIGVTAPAATNPGIPLSVIDDAKRVGQERLDARRQGYLDSYDSIPPEHTAPHLTVQQFKEGFAQTKYKSPITSLLIGVTDEDAHKVVSGHFYDLNKPSLGRRSGGPTLKAIAPQLWDM